MIHHEHMMFHQMFKQDCLYVLEGNAQSTFTSPVKEEVIEITMYGVRALVIRLSQRDEIRCVFDPS